MNIVDEFYLELEEEADEESSYLTRVIETVDIWRIYLDINAPLKFLLDQQDIILQTLQIYCGCESTCEFNQESKTVIIRGENGIVKTI